MDVIPTRRDAPPDVSFIFAVGDGWDATFDLLLGVAEASRGLRCEFIAVDDASGDETATALPQLEGIRSHRNPTPRGLVEARNQGAALARAPWLVFLDQGARPLPGWLASLESSSAEPTPVSALPCGGLLVRTDAFRAVGGFEDGPDARVAGEGLLRRLAAPRPTATAAAPLFTVLVPTCNQAERLPQALDSLLSQTHGDWEAVIVDEGSTDGTPAMLARYTERDPRFRVFHQRSGGVAAALNAGLRQARGAWVCWLCSDGLFLPEKLAVQLEAIRRHPETRFFHTGHLLLDEEHQRLLEPCPATRTLVPAPELQVVELLTRNYVTALGVAVHQAALEAVGPFDETLRQGQDHDMWLRLSARFPSRYLEGPTCVLRAPPEGSSPRCAASVLDSGRAAVRFLDAHPLEALFPLLDLRRPDQARQALAAVLRTAADPKAHLTASGYAPALLSRLAEWLTDRCPQPLRTELTHLHDDLIQALWQSDLPTWLKAPFLPLTGWPAPHVHCSGDALAVLEAHGRTLHLAGQVEVAADIEQYLQRLRPAAPERDQA